MNDAPDLQAAADELHAKAKRMAAEIWAGAQFPGRASIVLASAWRDAVVAEWQARYEASTGDAREVMNLAKRMAGAVHPPEYLDDPVHGLPAPPCVHEMKLSIDGAQIAINVAPPAVVPMMGTAMPLWARYIAAAQALWPLLHPVWGRIPKV